MLYFIGFIVLGFIVFTFIGKSSDETKKKLERAEKEVLEYDRVKAAKITTVIDSNTNELLIFYPACIEPLGVDDDGAIRSLGDNKSKMILLPSEFYSDIEDLRKELNDKFTLAYIIFIDAEKNTININDLESNEILEIVNYLDYGPWVVVRTKYSIDNGKEFIINTMDGDINLDKRAAILVKREDGQKFSATLDTDFLTQERRIN